MKESERTVKKIRDGLLDELNQEVENRFGSNKAKAAEAVAMNRIQFTNLCNEKVGATIDKLIQIGATLGWKIELTVNRKPGDKK
ncbi:MAG: hypothetical protein AB7K68_16395 [Bacteriovoracia bacterium]